MTTSKAYTDLEQSKKLAKILPLESADMDYIPVINIEGEYCINVNTWDNDHVIDEGWIPCWSLASLLNYLREIDFFPKIEANEFSVTMNVCYYDKNEGKVLTPVHEIKVEAESFVDTCYELILKLNEMKIL